MLACVTVLMCTCETVDVILQTQLKKSHRTRNDLLNAEIEQIHSAHKHDPLPPGVFHNGFHYVTMDGEKTDKHPRELTQSSSFVPW